MNIIPAVSISSFEGSKNYDLFSLLLKERILLLSGEVNDEMATVLIAEILYLSALSPDEKITLYINSPGGSVSSGLAIYDALKSSSCPIETIGIGLCASMGAFLLSAGTIGMRCCTQNCEIMIHQPLGGSEGQVSDLEIMTKRYLYLKDKLNHLLSIHTHQPFDRIVRDTDRNYFMNAEDAKAYGIVDIILPTMSTHKI